MPMNTNVMTIVLRERFGEYIISRGEGEQLGAEIAQAMRDGDDAALDFSGVRAVVSAFLNPAVGDLYGEFPADTVDARVHAVNASASQDETFRAVKRNGRRYYNDPDFRKNVIATRDELFD